MDSLLYFVWTADPILVEIGPLSIRWYGLLFAMAFMAGFYILQWIFKKEDRPAAWMDSVFITVMIGTIVGARLGHVFFYQWDYYQNNLMEIPMIWKGGLASHGAAIGIMIALYIWSKRVSKKSILWILDRVVIVVALSGLFIRGGNFVNHEIVGAKTKTESGVKFMRNYDDITPNDVQQVTQMSVYTDDNLDRSKLNEAYNELINNDKYADVIAQVPNRYPAQLYEAIAYLLVFLILMGAYIYTGVGALPGFMFGAYLTLAFTARFFIEFLKEVQVEFEESMVLDMGQWLSIPLVLAGLFFTIRAWRLKNKEASPS
ncbi:MAG TPA: prolipoprotein diacylglyceryl transferase [Flavobacteriales bacterium]|nr:prolipoprotein diacylglyceryl transferase [Flavobacteriales bacterium]